MTDITSIISDPDFEIYSLVIYSTSGEQNPGTDISAQFANYYYLPFAIDCIRNAAIDLEFSNVVQVLAEPGIVITLATKLDAHLQSLHGERVQDPRMQTTIRIAFRKNGSMNLLSMPRRASASYYPQTLGNTGSHEDGDLLITVYLDPETTETSLLTKHMTNHNAHYSAALARAGTNEEADPGPAPLLQNTKGEIFGTPFETVYFFRDGGWVTPNQASGCKLGITRRWALGNAGVREMTILAKDLKDGEEIWLSCTATGFEKGWVSLRK